MHILGHHTHKLLIRESEIITNDFSWKLGKLACNFVCVQSIFLLYCFLKMMFILNSGLNSFEGNKTALSFKPRMPSAIYLQNE